MMQGALSSLTAPMHRRCISTAAAVAKQQHQFKIRPAPISDLQPPKVLFDSNHLLAVYKPPGWHSIPNEADPETPRPSSFNDKCIRSYLIRKQMGGGSEHSYLNPLHRIDQPCSGVLLLGKTSKAAERLQPIWKQVEKTYFVVAVPKSYRGEMMLKDATGGPWKRMAGLTQPHKLSGSTLQQVKRQTKGWSVKMRPVLEKPELGKRKVKSDETLDETLEDTIQMRNGQKLCELQWRRVGIEPVFDTEAFLLEIRTQQGSRHMIRALMACYGIPVAGDKRYQATDVLGDQSVALHAYSLRLPNSLRLGDIQQRLFSAAIPKTWDRYFGITNEQVTQHLTDFPDWSTDQSANVVPK
jgi:23S rRNA-/tRNA-specific pseudouridylate synthase